MPGSFVYEGSILVFRVVLSFVLSMREVHFLYIDQSASGILVVVNFYIIVIPFSDGTYLHGIPTKPLKLFLADDIIVSSLQMCIIFSITIANNFLFFSDSSPIFA